jgi:hypothetical protein
LNERVFVQLEKVADKLTIFEMLSTVFNLSKMIHLLKYSDVGNGSEKMLVDARYPSKVWSTKCLTRPIVTRAHAPRQVHPLLLR